MKKGRSPIRAGGVKRVVLGVYQVEALLGAGSLLPVRKEGPEKGNREELLSFILLGGRQQINYFP